MSYPPKAKVMSKTFIAESTEEIDRIGNEFRKNNECVATQCDSINNNQRILFIQTIFYTERRDNA